MHARENKRKSILVAGPPDGHFKAPPGWGLGTLAVAALVAVIGTAIWAVAPSDEPSLGSGGSSVEPAANPTTVESSTSSASATASGPTMYLWDPNNGRVRVVYSAPSQPANAELSPDGKRVVYQREASDGRPQIYLLTSEGIERRLTDLENGAFDPTWSPDGKAIAFASSIGRNEDADIFVMDADGSHIRRLVGTPQNDGHPDWSPDGSRIAFHSFLHRYAQSLYGYEPRPGLIWMASVRTGSLTELRVPHGQIEPAWSPDGRWIAYVRVPGSMINGHPQSTDLWVTRPNGTHESRIAEKASSPLLQNPSWSPDGRLIVFDQGDWDWRRGTDGVGVVNPSTGRTRTILEGAAAAPSWTKEGILLSPPSGTPAPKPVAAPPEFQVGSLGIDATITLTRSSCQLDIPATTRRGRLKLELINHSHLEGGFRVTKLGPTQTLSQLRAHPRGFLFRGRRTEFYAPSAAGVWSSFARRAAGRWAVLCYKDKSPEPNGFFIVSIGVAGPINIG